MAGQLDGRQLTDQGIDTLDPQERRIVEQDGHAVE